MFAEYLAREHQELYAKTVEYGIDLDAFNALYKQSSSIALKAVQELIKTRVPTVPKLDHLTAFKELYKDDLDAAIRAYDQLTNDVLEYSKKTGIRMLIELDGAEPIRLGRAPKGSRKRPGRDLTILYQYIKYLIENGWSTSFDMRVFPSDTDPYESAVLLEDGTILADGVTYQVPKHWTTKVYRDAVRRGTRNTVVGSPWKGIQLQDQRGQWITLDRMWQQALFWYNSAEFEDDDEEEE